MTDDDLIRRGDALAVVRPTGERPCDCRGCRGSLPTAEDWARWDAFSRAAAAIAALPAVTVGVQEAVIHRAVLDWIKNDTGAAIKMTITPDQANAMTARILAALEPVAALDPAAMEKGDYFEGIEEGIQIGREAALREAAAVAQRYAETDYCAMGYPEDGGIAASGTAHTIQHDILALIQKGAADDR